MARMKDIVIKLQNGEELTADEMAVVVVVESGVDVNSYMPVGVGGMPVGVGAVAYGKSEIVKSIAEKNGYEVIDLRTKLDKSKITNIKFDGIDYKDAPKFCDAYISSADYDGKPMTSEQLDEINEDVDFVYSELMSYLY